MPPHARRSPRVAIQDWLSHTSVTSEAIKLPSKHGQVSNQAPRGRASRGHQDAEEELPQQRENNVEGRGRNPNKSPQDVKVHLRSASSKPKPGKTARSLGLDAPFRSFDYKNNAAGLLVDGETPVRKRKRSISSLSSYLETAKAINHQSGKNDRKRRNKSKANRDATSQSSDLLQSSDVTIDSPEKPVKVYGRRLRHKTREDCYELKQAKFPNKKREKNEKKDRCSKRNQKQKRKEKSGTALMHEFTAQNVAQDRLTLNSAPKLGLFIKGRASSSFQRGLPDLAFSEMTFLNPRKEKEEIPTKAEAKSRRKRDKNADAEAEMSRYFTSKKPSDYRKQPPEDLPTFESSPPKNRHEELHRIRKSSKREDPSLSLAGLPERPFLGFGSSGAPTMSPEMGFQMVHKSNRATQSQSRTLSPTRSTTYYTWSKTESRSPNSAKPHSIRSVRTRSLSRFSQRNLAQRDELLSPPDLKNNDSQERSGINRSCPRGGTSGSPNRDVARNDKDESLLGLMARSPGSQLKTNQPDQDKAASIAAKSSHKPKADSLVGGTVAGDASTDGGLIADRILPSSSGPYGLSTQMPLAAFDTVLETLMTNIKGPELQSLHNTACEASTMSGFQNRKQSISSCKISSACEPAKKGISLPEDGTNELLGEDLAPKYMGSKPTTISMPQIYGSRANQATHSSGPCLTTSGSGRGPAIRTNSFGENFSREMDRPRGNDGAVRTALNSWSGYDNLYEQQLASRDSYSNGNQDFHEYAPLKDRGFNGPVDCGNEAVDAEYDFEGYPNLENVSVPASQGHNQRLRLDEDPNYYHEDYHFNDEPNYYLHHQHSEFNHHENFFLGENKGPEEVLIYPPNRDYGRSDIYRMQNNPRTQTEPPEIPHPRDLAPHIKANGSQQEQNEEVTIPGFWKPNKLY